MEKKTVRQVKIEFREFVGISIDQWDDSEHEFWRKLNQLGWQKRTQEPEQCHDVDATAFLTDEEYADLTAEYSTLERSP